MNSIQKEVKREISKKFDSLHKDVKELKVLAVKRNIIRKLANDKSLVLEKSEDGNGIDVWRDYEKINRQRYPNLVAQ
jgi:hypothetical protein